MTTKIKTGLLATLFILGMIVSMRAQDRYEYAAVAYEFNGSNYSIAVSMNGKFEKKDVPRAEQKGSEYMEDLNPVLAVINHYAKEGWEVYNTTFLKYQDSWFQIMHYQLRRKIE